MACCCCACWAVAALVASGFLLAALHLMLAAQRFQLRTHSVLSRISELAGDRSPLPPDAKERVRALEAKVSGFVHDEKPLSLKQAVSEAVCLVVLGPLRVVCLVVALVGFAGFLFVLGSIVPFQPSHPKNPIRNKARVSHRLASAVLWVAVRFVLFAFGIYRVPHNLAPWDPYPAQARPVVLCNHTSALDPFVLAALLPLPSFVSKVEVLRVPVIATIARAFNCLFVEREHKQGGGKAGATAQLMERQNAKRAALSPLVIFPEGTTATNGVLAPFHTGPFLAGKPVHPHIVQFSNPHVNPAMDSIPPALYALRMLAQWHTSVRVTQLDVYVPGEAERADPHLFARNVRDVMCAAGLRPVEGDLRAKRVLEQLVAGSFTIWDALDALEEKKTK